MLIRAGSDDSDEAHPVVATARGVFDSKGGVLESKETGLLQDCAAFSVTSHLV